MSVIYCFRCDNHSDTDFFPCEEATNRHGEHELVCQRCAEDLEIAEDEGKEDEQGYKLIKRESVGVSDTPRGNPKVSPIN